MEKTKILYISQEITPFLPETEMSKLTRYLPQGIQEQGKEIRTFMPRYGLVNERRNQLHEVIRLSGMNIIIDDTDHPLIIKVASIQAARMQVYFIDNEDFFQRKALMADDEGNEFTDNDERAIFFARGVLETINKLQWTPDIVHCHGWFSFAVPLFLKTLYSYNTLFEKSKIITSIYDNEFQTPLSENLLQKIAGENITEEHLKHLKNPDFEGVSKFAIDHSDAVVQGSPTINDNLTTYIKDSGKAFLTYQDESTCVQTYADFYDEILKNT